VIKGMFAYHLFGYLWTVEYIKAIGIVTVAGAIGTDYWVQKDKASNFFPTFPVLPAFYRAIRYHAGSAIYGALILAIVRMIRYVMLYVDAKTAELQKDNFWVRVLFKVLHCMLWCLEKCMRFLTYSAYIMVAVEGRGFCVSAWRSFKLIFSNSLRVATTQALASLIILLAQVGITAFCTLTCWVAIKELPMYGIDGDYFVDLAYAPCVLVFVTSFFVTSKCSISVAPSGPVPHGSVRIFCAPKA
jgi:choline transporter-like protein 2/4/5